MKDVAERERKIRELTRRVREMNADLNVSSAEVIKADQKLVLLIWEAEGTG